MTHEVSIIGDRFMLSETFSDRIRAVCGETVRCRTLDFAWPDQPITQGYEADGIKGIKEYQGTVEQVVSHVGEAPILVTHLAPLSVDVFDQLPTLKLVVVSRGGPVNVDLAAAQKHSVAVAYTPGRNSTAVAEFTIGVILAETRNITKGHDALRDGRFRDDLYRADRVSHELSDMVVGIIGYGTVGQLVAKHLRHFGSTVLVSDPYVELSAGDAAGGIEIVELHDLLSRSDVVTLQARVTPATTGMMNARTFSMMKPGSIFVNTARGPLVDYDALYVALTDGPLRGAAIETFAYEPPPADLPLLQLPNVTLTPHIAGASLRTIDVAAQHAAEEVRRWINGDPLLNQCI